MGVGGFSFASDDYARFADFRFAVFFVAFFADFFFEDFFAAFFFAAIKIFIYANQRVFVMLMITTMIKYSLHTSMTFVRTHTREKIIYYVDNSKLFLKNFF